jgi:tRNA (mo5U34)-methyltransferase
VSADLHWYHTLELPGGELTPGWFDTRAAVDRVPWPAPSLSGLRCLDVGTWDGFWAFEMERRGAAEVVAIDIPDPTAWDWPARATPTGMAMLGVVKGEDQAFDVAARAYDSKVRREDLSVYDLAPERLGEFDLVFLGSLLLHLRDPVGALERIRTVCTGSLVVAETVELLSSLRWPRRPVARLEGTEAPWWWQPNVATVRRMVDAAGFRVVATRGMYFVPLGPAHPRPPLREQLSDARSPAGRERLVASWLGVPHTALRAVPSAA